MGNRAQWSFHTLRAHPVVLKLERPIVARNATITDWPLIHARFGFRSSMFPVNIL